MNNFKQTAKRAIISALCINLFLPLQAFAHDSVQPTKTPNPYHQLAELYLPSQGVLEQKEEVTLEQLQKEKKKIALQDTPLSKLEMLHIAFGPVAQATQQKTLADTTFLKKMEVFMGGESGKSSLMNALNLNSQGQKRTLSIMGERELAMMLAEQPTSDLNIIKRQHAVIQELANNPELARQIRIALSQIQETQEYMLSFWNKENSVNESLFQALYFGTWFDYGKLLKTLNSSTLSLETKTRLRQSYAFFPIIEVSLNVLLVQSTVYYVQDKISDIETSMPTCIKRMANEMITFPAKAHTFWKSIDTMPDLPIPPAQFKKILLGGGGLYLSIVLGMQGYKLWNSISDLQFKKDIANHLHHRMIGVAGYIAAINELQTLIQNNAVLQANLQSGILSALDQVHKNSKDLQQLLAKLNTNTFQGQASFFSLTGRVLAAYNLMKECKNDLVPALEAAGKIDAYHAIAQLFNDSKEQRAQYNVVQFIENDKPFIDAQEVWNPFINPTIVVSNDTQLGIHSMPNNIIVTGPNTGGKSTSIKALLISVLLAQKFGIAPAEKLVMTPFNNINCYMNITDDIGAGISLFKAEVLRAKELINSIRNCDETQFSFTVLDEVFSGTDPNIAAQAAYRFMQQLGEFTNSISVLATHFPVMTELEQEMGNAFKNYKVSVIKHDDGTLEFPYKLEAGIADTNIALELLEAEGVL